MKNPVEPDGGPVPKWMHRLIEKWRVADQAAAYPHAVLPHHQKPGPDASSDEHAPPRDESPSSSGEN